MKSGSKGTTKTTAAGRPGGRNGIAISLMRHLRATPYDGDLFEKSIAVLIPKQTDILPAIKAFVDTSDYWRQ